MTKKVNTKRLTKRVLFNMKQELLFDHCYIYMRVCVGGGGGDSVTCNALLQLLL